MPGQAASTGTARILALSGSLRRASSNTRLLQAARTVAPEGAEIVLYSGLGGLPHFNPDLEDTELPTVLDFRAALRESAGVLISSPEYAHGVPGVLKNALDWVVGTGELVDKPVALLNASPRATHAQASLIEILMVMGARLVDEASLTVQVMSNNVEEAALTSNAELVGALQSVIGILLQQIKNER